MKRKLLLSLVLFAGLIFSASYSHAQTSTTRSQLQYKGSSKKLGAMVADVLHFNIIVETLELLKLKENGMTFEIVMVGKLAKEIVEDPKLREGIDRSEKAGAKLVVCEYALDLFKVDKSKLDKRISKTPNAFLYMFELNDRGYNTITVIP